MERLPVLYVFVRTDLPSMTPGKAQAHSGHAANAFVNSYYIKKPQDAVISQSLREWMSATPQGFGTQINLKGEWSNVVNTLAAWCEAGGAGELVVDPTYPYIVDSEVVHLIDRKLHTVEPKDLGDGRWVCHRDEVTAAYLFGYKDELEPFVDKYPLHP